MHIAITIIIIETSALVCHLTFILRKACLFVVYLGLGLVYCSAPDKIVVAFPVTSNESNADLFLSYVPLKVNINILHKLSAFLKT